VENVLDFVHENDYLSVVAHPYREWGMGDHAKNYKFNAIEILNGGSSDSANEQAKELAKLMGLPGVAGSDAHQPAELCTVYNKIDATMDVDEILAAVKKGEITVSSFGKSIHF
jgi:predicted metal-dependent phosphoesterase TrpH